MPTHDPFIRHRHFDFFDFFDTRPLRWANPPEDDASKKKIRKPLRKKKVKSVPKCVHCGCLLDPNGKLYRTIRGSYACKKCFHRHYFTCVQCGHRHPKFTNQNSRFCRVCLRQRQQRQRPQNARDVSWGRNQLGFEPQGFDDIGSPRRFGLEIETSKCPWVERIQNKTLFGCKYDATVSGREFDSPVLQGDAGLNVIRDFCDMARSRGWEVDNCCGTHLHIDLSNTIEQDQKRIALAYLRTYPVWVNMVAENRRTNSYCAAPVYTKSQILHYTFYYLAYGTQRYFFVNLSSFIRHKTIEIRGLEGTLDKNLLVNWIKAHLRFTDTVTNCTFDEIDKLFHCNEEQCWKNLQQMLGPQLSRYFGRVRANRLSKRAL